MPILNQQSNATILGLILWCSMFTACQEIGQRKDHPAKLENEREVVTLKKQPLVSWPAKKQQIQDSLSLCRSWADSLICLNRFAHRDLSHGPSSLLVDSIVPDTMNRLWDCERWYYYILQDSVTVYCAGHTLFYSSLVTQFMSDDIVPHSFSIGTNDSKEGHTLSLIMTKRSGTINMYLFDPMFNSVYSLSNGQLADLRHLIYLARNKAYHLYRISAMNDQSGYLLRNENWITPSNAIYDLNFPYALEKSHNDSFPIKLRAKRTIEHYLTAGFDSAYQRIAEYHGDASVEFRSSNDFKKCVLFRIGLSGPFASVIDQELSSFELDNLQDLDALFFNYGLSVSQLDQAVK